MTANLTPLSSGPVMVWGEPTMCRVACCSERFSTSCSVVGSIKRFAGGSTFATAVGLAHLGTRVEFHGPFGSDDDGAWMLEYAKSRGVSVHPLASETSRSTLIVVDPDGTRSMVTDLGDAFTARYADSVDLERVRSGSMLYVSLSSLARDPHGSVVRLVRRCAGAVPLGIDLGSASVVSTLGEDLPGLLAELRPAVVFANEEEASAIRSVAPNSLHTIGCFVEKRGSQPAIVTVGGSIVEVPAESSAAAADTTGAGDAFAAGFIAAWARGETDPQMAARSGHAYATRAVAVPGTVVPA